MNSHTHTPGLPRKAGAISFEAVEGARGLRGPLSGECSSGAHTMLRKRKRIRRGIFAFSNVLIYIYIFIWSPPKEIYLRPNNTVKTSVL